MSQPVLGAPLDRVEGPGKVTGRIAYTADNDIPGMVHAVVVESTIANGRIAAIDESAARSAPGVIAIMTPRNAPRVDARKVDANDSLLFLLQGDAVEFDRQPVAVAIAETFEQATSLPASASSPTKSSANRRNTNAACRKTRLRAPQ